MLSVSAHEPEHEDEAGGGEAAALAGGCSAADILSLLQSLQDTSNTSLPAEMMQTVHTLHSRA